MAEVLDHYAPQFKASKALETLSLKRHEYFVVSVHREENVDNPENLALIVDILNALAERYRLPIILSTHPRTRKRLETLKGHKLHELIRDLKPFGFFDYVNMQSHAYCTLSDSGTVGEESAILNFPAVTLRTAMERPETLDEGSLVMTGLDKTTVLNAIEIARAGFSEYKVQATPNEYKILNVSQRVLQLIVGTCRLTNKWDGIVKYKN